MIKKTAPFTGCNHVESMPGPHHDASHRRPSGGWHNADEEDLNLYGTPALAIVIRSSPNAGCLRWRKDQFPVAFVVSRWPRGGWHELAAGKYAVRLTGVAPVILADNTKVSNNTRTGVFNNFGCNMQPLEPELRRNVQCLTVTCPFLHSTIDGRSGKIIATDQMNN